MIISSTAKLRLILSLIALFGVFMCTLVIMGLVGVNGRVSFQDYKKGCLLYMSIDGDVVSYNNGYCLFPVVASAVISVLTVLSMAYLAWVIYTKEEFSPRPISIGFIALGSALAVLSFVICGVIGNGLNKGCRILGDRIDSCRSNKNFHSLHGAQITAGIMGGFWLVLILLEIFQVIARPKVLASNSVGIASRTHTIPGRKPNSHIATHNVTNPNSTTSQHTSTPAQAHLSNHVSDTGNSGQPEMTSHHGYATSNNTTSQQQYYQPTTTLTRQQYYQLVSATSVPTQQQQYQQQQALQQQQQQQEYQYYQQTPQMQYQPIPVQPQVVQYQPVPIQPQVQYVQTPQVQYQQVPYQPQMQYQQIPIQTPQVQYQQVPVQMYQMPAQQSVTTTQQTPVLQSQSLSPPQQVYQPTPAPQTQPYQHVHYQPTSDPRTQSSSQAQPQRQQSSTFIEQGSSSSHVQQVQEPYPTHPTPISHLND